MLQILQMKRDFVSVDTDTQILRLLAKSGVGMDVVDHLGRTPLCSAVPFLSNRFLIIIRLSVLLPLFNLLLHSEESLRLERMLVSNIPSFLVVC